MLGVRGDPEAPPPRDLVLDHHPRTTNVETELYVVDLENFALRLPEENA